MNFSTMAKILIFIGAGIIILGGFMFLFSKIPFMKNLPGDIKIQRDNFTLYFPLASCIILSIVLTIIINVILLFFIKK
ncbi:MAG: DUF2905 domain-containing protein [Actinomycetota bacterium]|nr:DUF2905 domain-containing protein [Actinomycetota bacterium]